MFNPIVKRITCIWLNLLCTKASFLKATIFHISFTTFGSSWHEFLIYLQLFTGVMQWKLTYMAYAYASV